MKALNNPFVGLRAFESDESLLFFGRDAQILELMQRLHEHHFVGVIGSSGSGKSSLIKAGLVPRLKAGYLVGDKDRWTTFECKPGEAPLFNLATTILAGSDQPASKADAEKLVARIRENGVSAIADTLAPLLKDQRNNLFFLIDQFEELFRFAHNEEDPTQRDEATDFVNILLDLPNHKSIPAYVVITMRSDFIGECAQFYGLPEALNESQYLVPRLSRSQIKSAIEGPVKIFKGKINPAVTNGLMNDLQFVKDELPLLQHLLMRSWDHEEKTDHNGEVGPEDVEAVGGLEKALALHAGEAMISMSDREKKIAERMFQALTTTDHNGRKIRRPAHISELVKLTGAKEEEIRKIVQLFNDDKRSFLILSKGADGKDTLLDISHESLIRQWPTLNEWVESESESAKTYWQLTESMLLHKQGKKDFLGGMELQVALSWFEERNPDKTWAARYNDDFEETQKFLEASIKQADAEKIEKEEARKVALAAAHQKKLLKRTTILLAVIVLFLTADIISTIQFYQQKRKALKALDINTRALDSLYVAKEKVLAGCWEMFVPVEIVLREGNPEYGKKPGKAGPGNNTNSPGKYDPSGITTEQVTSNTGQTVAPGQSSAPGSPATGDTKTGTPTNQPSVQPGVQPSVTAPASSGQGSETPQLTAETKPEFPGGSKAMKKFIMENIEYPDEALKDNISGEVRLKFIVSSTGQLQDVSVIGKRIGYGLEEAAIAVLNKMPNWKPAMKDGKPVAFYYTLPISFVPPKNH